MDDRGREELATEYARALQEYIAGAGEAALVRAYELGRQAAAGGLGPVDLAIVHHDALLRLGDGGRGARAVAMAAQFLAESLSPFEMTLRSYQANSRLLGLAETLEQQNAEIDRAREQLRTILDATTAVIYLKDAEGRYLFVNRQFEQVFRLRREDVVGRRDEEALPPAVARTLRAHDREVVHARAPRELEETLPGAGGEHTYLSLKFPLVDEAGVAYGVCCVATDVTEHKRAQEALLQARQLQEAMKARDQFLAITSHELKTPLTSLELQVASLRRIARSNTAELDERLSKKCDVILRQVDRLTVLINNLIDVGRITSGRMELRREQLDLADVVGSVLGRARESILHSGSQVTVRVARPAVGSWDRRRLETAVANLLSNAVKFGSGAPIEVTVSASGGRGLLAVRDHGIGISGADQERIFARFERAVSERHYGGFGIGLWVARQAVEAHGGVIRVRSELGRGSEFEIELPLEPAEAELQPAT